MSNLQEMIETSSKLVNDLHNSGDRARFRQESNRLHDLKMISMAIKYRSDWGLADDAVTPYCDGQPWSMESLAEFLKNSRNWAKAIPLMEALQKNDPKGFLHWLCFGSTIVLRELCAALPEEIKAKLYEDRGKDIHDPMPYENDGHALDTSRYYMMSFNLLQVDDPRKEEVFS